MTAGSLTDPGTVRPSSTPGPDGARNTLLALLVFVVAASLAIGGAVLYFRGEKAEVYDDAAQQLRLMTEMKQRQLSQWRLERRGDAEVLFRRNAQSSSMLRTLASAADSADRRVVDTWIESYLTAYNEYDRVYLLTADTTLTLARPDPREAPSTVLLQQTREAIIERAPRFVDVYIDEHDHLPHLALVVPVLDSRADGRSVGAMVLRINPAGFLYPMLASDRASRETGETQLARRVGDTVQFLNPLRFAPGAVLTMQGAANESQHLAGQAAAGRVGLVRGTSYTGAEALGYISPIEGSPWVLTSWVDTKELDAGLRRHLLLITTGVALLILSLGTIVLLWRREQRLRTYMRQVELTEALEDSEERLRLALAAASQGLYDLDLASGQATVSPEYAVMLGYEADSFTESIESWRARVHPDDRDAATQALTAYLDGRTPVYHEEFRLQTRAGDWKWVLSVGQIVSRNTDGTPRRMIGTHTDITRLKWAQEGQARATAHLRSLLRHSPTVVYSVQMVNGRLRPVAVSENIERILGYSLAEALEPDFWMSHVHPDDRSEAGAFAAALATSDELSHEYQFMRKDGSIAVVHDSLTVVRRDTDGMPIDIVGAWIDITERHQSERALRESEERLRLAVAGSGQGLWDLRLPSGEVVVSPEYARMLGYEPERFTETNTEWFRRVHPDDLARVQLATAESMSGGQDAYRVEYRMRDATGGWRWVRAAGEVVERSLDGRATRAIGTLTDITASRDRDDALRDSEARLRLAMVAARQGIWDIDLATGTVLTSPEYAEMLGFDPAAFQETPAAWNARLHPDDVERYERALHDYVEGRRPDYDVEFRQHRQDGSWIWIRSTGRIVERSAAGMPTRVLGIHTDISARKQAELAAERVSRLYLTLSRCNEAIARSTAPAELFVEICRAAVEEGGLTMAWVGLVNEATHCMDVVASYGDGLAYLDGLTVSVDPDSPFGRGPAGSAVREKRAIWVDDFQRDPSTEPWRDRAAAFGWSASASVPLIRRGMAVGALTLYTRAGRFEFDSRRLLEEMAADIRFALEAFERESQRLQAEERLRQSEARYRTLFAESGLPMLLIDTSTGQIADANLAAASFYGWDLSSLRQMNMSDIDGIPADVMHERAQGLLGSGSETFHVDHRLANGSTRHVEGFATRVSMDRQQFGLAIIVDVTARHLAESALREKEYQLTEAQRLTHMGSWIFRPDGTGLWSDEMFRLFQLPPGPTAPMPEAFSQRVHPDDQPAMLRAVEATFEGSAASDLEYRVVLPDGSLRYMSARAERREDASGPFLAGTVQDVTARHLAEATLRMSLEEKEALLKEVHHRVKNNLQVISSLLRLELGRSADGGVKTVLTEMQNRVISMALLHEMLYRSDSFARIDLADYLARLVNQLFRASAPPAGRVTLRTALEPCTIDLEQALPCGLVVTELLSNSLKHAFPDNRSGDVLVSLTRVDGGPALRLVIADTGVGLPADFDERRAHSLGHQLVSDLQRQLRGTLDIGRTPGTTFTLTFTPRAASPAAHG